MVFGEAELRRLLKSYASYYNRFLEILNLSGASPKDYSVLL
jgi:hypothetical protein